MTIPRDDFDATSMHLGTGGVHRRDRGRTKKRSKERGKQEEDLHYKKLFTTCTITNNN